MTQAVQEYGNDRCRYMVASRTRHRHNYLVDLLANRGLGECACKHWTTTIWPRVRDGVVTIDSPNSRCWHIPRPESFF